jgi:hypothetical protein
MLMHPSQTLTASKPTAIINPHIFRSRPLLYYRSPNKRQHNNIPLQRTLDSRTYIRKIPTHQCRRPLTLATCHCAEHQRRSSPRAITRLGLFRLNRRSHLRHRNRATAQRRRETRSSHQQPTKSRRIRRHVLLWCQRERGRFLQGE